MRFNCQFEHIKTGKCKTIQTTLTPTECQDVKDARRREGDKTADVRAMAMALRHAYATIPKKEIGPNGWFQSSPPTLILVS